MNKAGLIDKIAEDTKLTKAMSSEVLDSALSTITRALKRNEKVTLVGFGAFSISKRKARTGRNPRTGEPLRIKASRSVKFTAGKTLKQEVN